MRPLTPRLLEALRLRRELCRRLTAEPRPDPTPTEQYEWRRACLAVRRLREERSPK